jgi:hypothetical protein
MPNQGRIGPTGDANGPKGLQRKSFSILPDGLTGDVAVKGRISRSDGNRWDGSISKDGTNRRGGGTAIGFSWGSSLRRGEGNKTWMRWTSCLQESAGQRALRILIAFVNNCEMKGCCYKAI